MSPFSLPRVPESSPGNNLTQVSRLIEEDPEPERGLFACFYPQRELILFIETLPFYSGVVLLPFS